MLLNLSIPGFRAYVRKSWLTKNQNQNNEFVNVYVFGIQSVSNKILTFHVMSDYGAMRSRVPVSEVFTKIPTKDISYDMKQLWGCFGENVTVTVFEYLKGRICNVLLKDKTTVKCRYMLTVDWFKNEYSENAYDYKSGHLLESLDFGFLLVQPNNRIISWIDPNFCLNEKKEATFWKVDEFIPQPEDRPKWLSDTDDYFYDVF